MSFVFDNISGRIVLEPQDLTHKKVVSFKGLPSPVPSTVDNIRFAMKGFIGSRAAFSSQGVTATGGGSQLVARPGMPGYNAPPVGTKKGNLVMGRYGFYYPKLRKLQDIAVAAHQKHVEPHLLLGARDVMFRNFIFAYGAAVAAYSVYNIYFICFGKPKVRN